jgi:hypothetical protein
MFDLAHSAPTRPLLLAPAKVKWLRWPLISTGSFGYRALAKVKWLAQHKDRQ